MSDMHSLQTMGGDFARDLGNAVRRNPISAALIGMGALWLVMGNQPVKRAARLARRSGLDRLPDRATDLLSSSTDAVRGSFDAVSDSVSDATDAASRLVRSTSQKVSRTMRDLPEHGSDAFESARDRLADMLEEQPLVLGAIGLAIGATVAASLPPTRLESEYLGAVSDDFREQAVAFVGGEAMRVRDRAENAAAAAFDEAKRQGLTPDGLKAAVDTIGERLTNVAAAAKTGATSF